MLRDGIALLVPPISEDEKLIEAWLLLDWSRSLPEHHLQYDEWLERTLTRAAASA